MKNSPVMLLDQGLAQPPLTTTVDEAHEGLDILDQALAEAELQTG